MSFLWPWMLLSLPMVPLLAALYVRMLRRRQRAWAGLSELGLAPSQPRRASGVRRHTPPVFFLLGLALLLFGLARPQMVLSLPRVEGTVILAFDVSSSMSAGDLEPTRIEAAKTAARTFVENQPGTIQIGVVAFSNGGLVVQQPTDDRVAILSTIERLSPQGGTSLGQGIYTALNAIAGEPLTVDAEALAQGAPLELENFPSAVVLLLTDGENTDPPDPLEIAQVAAEAGVRIYPVGIGSPGGTVLEIDGFSVLTRLDEASLQGIASLTNGAYYYAADAQKLQEIYEKVDLRLAVRGEESEITAVVAGASLLLILLGGALSLLWFGRAP